MNESHKKKVSKFLSFILRHQPELIGLHLDQNGWANIEELLAKSAQFGTGFSLKELIEIVVTNDKQRFMFNADQTAIRASQGHSIAVDVEPDIKEPPEQLFHGTVSKFLEGIHENGLLKMSRQHVHLSETLETAQKVGSRRGKPVILTIKSGQMHQAGFAFYLSANGVWLTDHVPSIYIQDGTTKEDD